MTPTQGLLSLLFVAHIGATLVGAMPTLDDFGTDTTIPRPPGATVQSHVTATLDDAAVAAVRLHRIAWALTSPLHGPVRLYLDLTDQFSKWNMFSTPARVSEYARLDYHLARPDGSRLVVSELMYPAAEPGKWRVFSAYFASFIDKAFANATQSYQTRAFRANLLGRPAPASEMKEDLLPFMRYYGRRRVASLPAGTRLERTEFWWGWAPSPPPAEALPASVLLARQQTLDELKQTTGRTSPAQPASRQQWPTERQGDITWQLWAVDAPDGS